MNRRVLTVALILLAGQVAAVGVGAYVYAWYENSLEGGGRWIASKNRLERRVMGSAAFATSHHTLSGEHLDLGRWFAYQEVLLAEPVAAREVAFDFRPQRGAYLCFLFALGPEGGSALRLSTEPRFPSGTLTYDAEGEFRDFERLPAFDVAPGTWSHVELALGPAGATAALNAGSPQRVGVAPAEQRFGFRSGLQPVLVDDVSVRCDGAGGFDETFFDAAAFRRGLLALVGLLAADVAVWRLVRRGRLSHEWLVRLALGGAACLAAGAVGVFLLQRAKAGQYPRMNRIAEDVWLEREVQDVTQRIDAEHGRSKGEGTRVLVVGTSQTWGAGAEHARDGFVEVLERLLTAAEPERHWECINAGVQGLKSPWLLQLFRERWLALEPDVVVVNLSNNDKDPEPFAQALRGFAELAREHGIALLFALEANSIEHTPGELPLHPTMRKVAEEYGVPIVDVHAALAKQYDRGFLWWDAVHPTSFGHRLIAETLLPEVRRLAPVASSPGYGTPDPAK